MNILFIEDERELREGGVSQLESHGHTVYPVSNLVIARDVMEKPTMLVDLVIADHSLPDGQGIHFVVDMKAQFPKCLYAIVSGCLTEQDMHILKTQQIPYYSKPLLYGKVVEELRRKHLMQAPCRLESADQSTKSIAAAGEVSTAPTKTEQRKKWFGLFRK